jgi:hypothetical protein
MEDRTTAELIEALGEDVDRCHQDLIASIDAAERDADGSVDAQYYEYHARQLIRSILAYIEGITFSAKVTAVRKCLDAGFAVTDHERYLACELDAGLNDKGEVDQYPAKLRLASNIRFAFRLMERARGRPIGFDPKASWWSDLKKTIEVRNRLTHPRMPGDLDVHGDEVVAALSAMRGFDAILLKDIGSKEG